MKLREILSNKGDQVHTISPAATLHEVAQSLVRFNIGSLVVCKSEPCEDNRNILGIITERDILRTQADHQTSLGDVRVEHVMSKDLVTAGPEDPIEHAMVLMTTRRVRHLPIVENGQLRGIISIGDVVKAHHDELEMENHFMKSYIQGEGAEVTTIIEISE